MCMTGEIAGTRFSSETATEDDIPSCAPRDAVSQAVFSYAKQHLHPSILRHSLRVFLYMIILSERDGTSWHDEGHLPLLFASALFHDFGTTSVCDGPERFEVAGADAAVDFLTSQGVSKDHCHEVWVAIACHTSAGIGERISILARLQRLGPLADFKRPDILALIQEADVKKAEAQFPRGEIEKTLSDTVVEQALQQRSRAPPATWPGVLLRFQDENPDWKGINKEF